MLRCLREMLDLSRPSKQFLEMPRHGMCSCWIAARATPTSTTSKNHSLRQPGLLEQFPADVWQAEWVVHCKPVGAGQAAMKYLAPYIFRVAISNHRIQSIEPGEDLQGQVKYEYRPVGSRKVHTLKVSAQEFIRRFLQHVLPSGFRKVRHYGLASARSQQDIELLKWLVTVTLQLVYTLTVCPKQSVPKPQPRCEHCGGALKLYGITPPPTRGYDTS